AQIIQPRAVVEKGMLWSSRHRPTHNLTRIINGVGFGLLCSGEHSQVGHLTLIIKERVDGAAARIRKAHNLPILVKSESSAAAHRTQTANIITQGSQIGQGAIATEEGV